MSGRLASWLLPLALALAGAGAAAETPTVEATIARYLEARGGAERWRRLQSLEIRGTYAAFSFRSEFTLIRRRGDIYRLDFTLLGDPAVRARDAQGAWWLHKLLQPEPARLEDGPYRIQLERESLFEPPLLAHETKGVTVELLGPGEVDGRPTVDLRVVLPGGQEETWHLDAETHLEVAVDSTVSDFTQAAEPMAQRTFYDDFRAVDGLVLPFQVDIEFGARLESMTVESVEIDPDLEPDRFHPPPIEPTPPAPEGG